MIKKERISKANYGYNQFFASLLVSLFAPPTQRNCLKISVRCETKNTTSHSQYGIEPGASDLQLLTFNYSLSITNPAFYYN